MNKKLPKNNEELAWKSYKKEEMGVSVEYVPKKGIIMWKMAICSECRKDNIFSIRLDLEYLDYLKKVIEEGKELDRETLDKILKAFASLAPSRNKK